MKSTKFKNSFSEDVWQSTYKDYNDRDINDTLMRVAKAVSGAEKNNNLRDEWKDKFYDLLTDFKFTAGGRIFANAGTEWKGTTLFNCYTSPRRKYDIDSLDNIIVSLSEQAFTLKSEGGIGENFCVKFNEIIQIRKKDNGPIELMTIEEVQNGYYVLGSDSEWHKVEETITTIKNKMVELEFDNGKLSHFTIDHPFLVIRNNVEQWVEAQYLKETDELVTTNIDA